MNANPFEQGYIAATDGLPASANPYAVGTAENARWNEGYHALTDQPDQADELGVADEPTMNPVTFSRDR